MERFARAIMSVLLLAAAGLGAGCSSSEGGLVTGATPAAADRNLDTLSPQDKLWKEMDDRSKGG